MTPEEIFPKFRIIEETTFDGSKYYVQERLMFLFFHFWVYRVASAYGEAQYEFASMEAARKFVFDERNRELMGCKRTITYY